MNNEIREELADLCHKQWSGWMKYLFSKCGRDVSTKHLLIPHWEEDRWGRQMNIPYNELSSEEQDSDRTEADKFIALLNQEPCHVCKGLRDKYCHPTGTMIPCPKYQEPCSLCGGSERVPENRGDGLQYKPCPKCQSQEPARREGKHKLVYDKLSRTIVGYCKLHDVYYQTSGECYKCKPESQEPDKPGEPVSEFVKECKKLCYSYESGWDAKGDTVVPHPLAVCAHKLGELCDRLEAETKRADAAEKTLKRFPDYFAYEREYKQLELKLKTAEGKIVDSFMKGYEEGVTDYAWWKDGVQYVGTCGKTLDQALKGETK